MKPSPIVTGTICSACGLDWDRHDKKTLDTCVELLKADLAREKQRLTPQPVLPVPYPYPVPARPYPQPYPWISRPNWFQQPTWISQPTITSGTTNPSQSLTSMTSGTCLQ